MKRYMLFFGKNFHPFGGMEDFVNSFENIIDAEKFIIDKLNEYGKIIGIGTEFENEFDGTFWFQIFDLQKNEIVRDDFESLFKRHGFEVKIID